jgi:phosphohistidine phosphatase
MPGDALMMHLYLVQHGEAQAEAVDASRPLTSAGREDIARLALVLAHAGVRVHRVLNSGKLRARASAEALATAIAPNVPIQDRDKLSPKDSTEWLADETVLWQEDTLIVGHQPFMSRLVSRLVLGKEQPLIADFTPGTAVCLVRRPLTGAWFIAWMVAPALLRR